MDVEREDEAQLVDLRDVLQELDIITDRLNENGLDNQPIVTLLDVLRMRLLELRR